MIPPPYLFLRMGKAETTHHPISHARRFSDFQNDNKKYSIMAKRYTFKIPDWVQPGTKDFIKAVVKSVTPRPEDEGLLMSLCANYDTMLQARDTIASEGVCIKSGAKTVRHPATAVLKQSSDLVVTICKSFRITRRDSPANKDEELTELERFLMGK